MSALLRIELGEDAKQLMGSMANRDGRYDRALAKELDRQNELTIGYAQRNKLSGASATTLGVRTGLLRRSLRRTDAVITGTSIDGAIGSNVVYAGVHEYGFDGEVQVHAFVRRNRRRDVFGVKGRKVTANGVSYVRAFSRHMRMPERSFIRSSIEERLPQYSRGLSRAVVAALEGTP